MPPLDSVDLLNGPTPPEVWTQKRAWDPHRSGNQDDLAGQDPKLGQYRALNEFVAPHMQGQRRSERKIGNTPANTHLHGGDSAVARSPRQVVPQQGFIALSSGQRHFSRLLPTFQQLDYACYDAFASTALHWKLQHYWSGNLYSQDKLCAVSTATQDTAKTAIQKLRGIRLCPEGCEHRITHLIVGKERRTLKVRANAVLKILEQHGLQASEKSISCIMNAAETWSAAGVQDEHSILGKAVFTWAYQT